MFEITLQGTVDTPKLLVIKCCKTDYNTKLLFSTGSACRK